MDYEAVTAISAVIGGFGAFAAYETGSYLFGERLQPLPVWKRRILLGFFTFSVAISIFAIGFALIESGKIKSDNFFGGTSHRHRSLI
jgi:hypothetical protein